MTDPAPGPSLLDRLSPRQIFIADALGAVTTASLLGLVLVRFASLMGLPARAFHLLAAIVLVYALYSAAVAVVEPARWVVALRIIAGANLAYCVMTLSLLVVFRERVTLLGVAWFVGEAILIAAIARVELLYAAKHRE